jgi:hypothetical protein
MTGDKPDVVLIRVRLHDQPQAQAYYLARRAIAERLQRDAEGSGDQVEILPRRSFAVSAAIPPAEVGQRELRLLGTDVAGTWVQPPGTGQAAQRN